MQDDYQLTGTLGDNICFFHPQPDQAVIENVSRFALIHDDIARMPMAYSSLASDMGTALPSDQRQRILLARAMYRDPDVLSLDEGTANLDETTEAILARRIAATPITRVAVSHRPARSDERMAHQHLMLCFFDFDLPLVRLALVWLFFDLEPPQGGGGGQAHQQSQPPAP